MPRTSAGTATHCFHPRSCPRPHVRLGLGGDPACLLPAPSLTHTGCVGAALKPLLSKLCNLWRSPPGRRQELVFVVDAWRALTGAGSNQLPTAATVRRGLGPLSQSKRRAVWRTKTHVDADGWGLSCGPGRCPLPSWLRAEEGISEVLGG